MSDSVAQPSSIAGLRHRSSIDLAVMKRIRLVPVARSEFLLVSHLLPLVIAVTGKSHDLMTVISPSALSRQIVDRNNRWLAPYQPVFVRSLAFELARETSGDPLTDLRPKPGTGLVSKDIGEPVLGQGLLPSPGVRAIHSILMQARAGLPVLMQALDALLITGVATPLGPDADFLVSKRVPRPRLYSVSPDRLEALSPLVLGRLARDSFVAVELGYAIAFSRRWLLPNLVLSEMISAGKDTKPRRHGQFLLAARADDPVSLGFDESDLFQFP